VFKRPVEKHHRGLNHVTYGFLLQLASALQSWKLPPAPETGGNAHTCSTAIHNTHPKGQVSFQLLFDPNITSGSHVLLTAKGRMEEMTQDYVFTGFCLYSPPCQHAISCRGQTSGLPSTLQWSTERS